jgi:hypothetical protein
MVYFVTETFVGCGPLSFPVRVAAGRFARLVPACTAGGTGNRQYLRRSKRIHTDFLATILIPCPRVGRVVSAAFCKFSQSDEVG